MAYEPRPGSGTLFRNDKQGNDRAPDYKGDLCLPDGEVIKLAGWIKDGKNGKFLSISIDKPREQSTDSFRGGGSKAVAGDDRRGAPSAFDLDDEIPF